MLYQASRIAADDPPAADCRRCYIGPRLVLYVAGRSLRSLSTRFADLDRRFDIVDKYLGHTSVSLLLIWKSP